MKLDILAFGAHPDDVELGCAGTLLSHQAQGKKIGVVDLTRGELGTRGTAEDRDVEAAASSQILRLDVRENLGMADGFFAVDKAHQLQVIAAIRAYRPEVVLANAVGDRHIDHGRAARLVAEACFLSGLRKIVTERDGIPQEAWRPRAVYHYIQDQFIVPDFVVDITDVFQVKMEAVKAFRTQFFDPDSSEPATPISSKDFVDFLEARARNMGRVIGATYGEGFTVNRAPGIKDITTLI